MHAVKLRIPQPPIPPHCTRCGYDLAQTLSINPNDAPICPECANSVDPAAPGGKRISLFLAIPMGFGTILAVPAYGVTIYMLLAATKGARTMGDPHPWSTVLHLLWTEFPNRLVWLAAFLLCSSISAWLLLNRNSAFYRMPYKERRSIQTTMKWSAIVYGSLVTALFILSPPW